MIDTTRQNKTRQGKPREYRNSTPPRMIPRTSRQDQTISSVQSRPSQLTTVRKGCPPPVQQGIIPHGVPWLLFWLLTVLRLDGESRSAESRKKCPHEIPLPPSRPGRGSPTDRHYGASRDAPLCFKSRLPREQGLYLYTHNQVSTAQRTTKHAA